MVGARLSQFVQQWEEVLGPCRAVQTLQSGVLLEFDQNPPLSRYPRAFSTRNSRQDLQLAVEKLLQKGAVEKVRCARTKGFYSRLFLVPKKTGDMRPVIDLSCLNRHLVVPHFKMETQSSVRGAIRQGEWTVSIDIQDAYLHVPMGRKIRKFLRFMVNGQVYQFTCLPFGLATSPREFTKLLRPVVQLLRLQGIRLHVYLDDWLIRADSPEEVSDHARLVIQLLQHLGWLVNYAKSDLTPSRDFHFIGMHFRTVPHTVAPLPKMRIKVQGILDHWRIAQDVSARDVHHMLGVLNYMAGLVPRGRLRFRPIQWWAMEAWDQVRGLWSDRINVPASIIHQIAWWASPAVNQGLSLLSREAELTLFTDASLQGWGAQLGQRSLQGQWTPAQREQHINVLELEAILKAVRGFLPQLRHKVVRVMCDNATAISYIKKEGGTKSFRLVRLTIRLLRFCDNKDIHLVPVHLPGVRNVQADSLSRVGQVLSTEWEIDSQLLLPVFRQWGQPQIDLFATYANKKCEMFVSPFPDPRAHSVDALSIPWQGLGLLYAFPPFRLLPAVLSKFRQNQGCQLILIAPRQLSASWMPELLQLSKEDPIPLAVDGLPLLTQEVRLADGGSELRHYRPSDLHAWRL